MFVLYAELHCHSAFSFLDGASLPDELAAAALEAGYEALALTDHNTVSGSMEFAVSARALGLHAIHGAELDLDDGRHLTLLVQDATGWPSLCRLLTRAHAHTRDQGPGPPSEPSAPLDDVLQRRRRARLPERLRGPRRARRADALAGCARRSAPSACGSSSSVPTSATIAPATAAWPGSRSASASPCVATGDVHAHSRIRAPLQDALRRDSHAFARSTPPSRDRRGNFSHVLASPAAMASTLPRVSGGGAPRPRGSPSSSTFDLCSDLGYRYPGAEDAAALRKLRELCEVRLARSLRPRAPGALEAAPARLEEELRIIEKLGPGRLLPAAPRPARARARGGASRCAGRRQTRRARCCPPVAAEARASPRSSAT